MTKKDEKRKDEKRQNDYLIKEIKKEHEGIILEEISENRPYKEFEDKLNSALSKLAREDSIKDEKRK